MLGLSYWFITMVIGLIVAIIIGKLSLFREGFADARRRFNEKPLDIIAIVFAVVFMFFMFLEGWNKILNSVLQTMNPQSPVGTAAAVFLSGLAITLMSVLYGLIVRGVGRASSAMKLQRIYEKRWYLRHLKVESEEENDTVDSMAAEAAMAK